MSAGGGVRHLWNLYDEDADADHWIASESEEGARKAYREIECATEPAEITVKMVPDDALVPIHTDDLDPPFPEGARVDRTKGAVGTAVIEAAAGAWAKHFPEGGYVPGSEW